MAKLNLELDTQEGLMNVSVNGKTVENVTSIEISHFPESQFGDAESHFVITTIEVDRDSDLSQITRSVEEAVPLACRSKFTRHHVHVVNGAAVQGRHINDG